MKKNNVSRNRKRVASKIRTLLLCMICLAVLVLLWRYAVRNLFWGDSKVEVEVGSSIDANDFLPKFLGRWYIQKYNISDVPDTYEKIGEFEVKYEPTWLFAKEIILKVSVIDKVAPQIFLPEIEEKTVFQSINEVINRDFKAVDNYDGDLTSRVKISYTRTRPNWYTVEYTVEDSSGNGVVVTQNANVIGGYVALTFDDGPCYDTTPQILDILEENKIYATFFVLGFKGKEDLIMREFGDGHQIGYKGYSHEYDFYSSVESVIDNFKKCEEEVLNTTKGVSSNLVRFPGGSSNTVSRKYCKGIMTQSVKAVEEEGFTYYDWNIDAEDATFADTKTKVVNNVIYGIKRGRMNVVLMHDSAGKQHTVDALQEIIDYCKENDYIFVKLTTELVPVHHKVQN